MRMLYPICALVISACATPQPTRSPGTVNLFGTDKAWSILQAQDHRDAAQLASFLSDTSATIRAQAALALASVGTASVVPDLLHALEDVDPRVRANAAFAFGFCGDSVSVHRLIERFSPEGNTAVRGRIAEAAGRCGRRAGADLLLRRTLSTKADSLGVLRGLFFATTSGSTDTSHVRFALSLITSRDAELDEAALQVCARSNADLLRPFVKQLLDVAMTMPDDGYVALRLPLLAALGKTGNDDAFLRLQGSLENDPDPQVRAMALRSIARFEEPRKNPFIWNALKDSSAMVRDLAMEQFLLLKELPSGENMWTLAQEHYDYSVKIPLYGLVMQDAEENTRRTCAMLMASMAKQDLGPYLNAALFTAQASLFPAEGVLDILRTNGSAPTRQAAFTAANSAIRERMARSRFASPEAQYRELTELVQAAISTGDAGLIASAAELVSAEDGNAIALLLDPSTEAKARAALKPIRDLETLQLLDKAAAKRDGRPAPSHVPTIWNHPIDRDRLAAIIPDQRYRVRTNRGDIVLAVEPGTAPGSCTAFDSLVAAGYYNGKYFHRVVPDFVAQGGCPRGDGYGSMDWTLRTEVGLEGFTTGAVGLASAGKDTESCQFFIMLADAPHLDGRYTRFAHVVSGMEVATELRVGDRMLTVERQP